MGPRCSARGPRAATGRKSKAPMMRTVPRRRKPMDFSFDFDFLAGDEEQIA
jgi:hypothetical protein